MDSDDGEFRQPVKRRRLGFHRSAKATQAEVITTPEDEVKLDTTHEAEPEPEEVYEDEFVYDLSDDDEDEHYRNTTEDMFCEVCDKKFLVLRQFKGHHRRHFALDHYQCPTCLLGFITLRSCYLHELRVHKNKGGPGDGNAPNDDEDDETSVNRILPSSSLLCYRGPPVKCPGDAFDIEEKYGLRGRRKGEIALQIARLKKIEE